MDFIALPTLGPSESLSDAVAKMRGHGTRAVVVLHGQDNARIYLNSEIAQAMVDGARSVAELPPSDREVVELNQPLPLDLEQTLDGLGVRYGLSHRAGPRVTVVTRFERLAQDINMAAPVCMCTNPQTRHLARSADGTCTTCGYPVECF